MAKFKTNNQTSKEIFKLTTDNEVKVFIPSEAWYKFIYHRLKFIVSERILFS